MEMKYSMKQLCDELKQPRQKVRRRIESLGLEANNEYTRKHKNEPFEYSREVFLTLSQEFGLHENQTKRENNSSTSDVQKDKIIEILEKQLEESNRSRENLERLLNQQQQLSLLSNKENEILKLKINEFEENSEEYKKTWLGLYRRSKKHEE